MNSTDVNRLYASMGNRYIATIDEYIRRRELHLSIDTQTLNDLVCGVKLHASMCGIQIKGGLAIQAAINAIVEVHQQANEVKA